MRSPMKYIWLESTSKLILNNFELKKSKLKLNSKSLKLTFGLSD